MFRIVHALRSDDDSRRRRDISVTRLPTAALILTGLLWTRLRSSGNVWGFEDYDSRLLLQDWVMKATARQRSHYIQSPQPLGWLALQRCAHCLTRSAHSPSSHTACIYTFRHRALPQTAATYFIHNIHSYSTASGLLAFNNSQHMKSDAASSKPQMASRSPTFPRDEQPDKADTLPS
jgi:hypothetical protein